MEKGQLDGLPPTPKERLLLRLLTHERHTGMTAERAELDQLSTVAPEPVHARVAQHFPAMGALVRRARMGVARTDQRAVRQYHRRRRVRHLELGNGDCDFGALNQEFHFSQVQRLADREAGFLDSLAAHVSSVARTTIAYKDCFAGQHDFAMPGRHGGMLNLKVILGAAPEMVDTQVELNHSTIKACGFYH